MGYYAYTRDVIECPQCIPCPEHEGHAWKVFKPGAQRFWYVNDKGERLELTRKEYEEKSLG